MNQETVEKLDNKTYLVVKKKWKILLDLGAE